MPALMRPKACREDRDAANLPGSWMDMRSSGAGISGGGVNSSQPVRLCSSVAIMPQLPVSSLLAKLNMSRLLLLATGRSGLDRFGIEE